MGKAWWELRGITASLRPREGRGRRGRALEGRAKCSEEEEEEGEKERSKDKLDEEKKRKSGPVKHYVAKETSIKRKPRKKQKEKVVEDVGSEEGRA